MGILYIHRPIPNLLREVPYSLNRTSYPTYPHGVRRPTPPERINFRAIGEFVARSVHAFRQPSQRIHLQRLTELSRFASRGQGVFFPSTPWRITRPNGIPQE